MISCNADESDDEGVSSAAKAPEAQSNIDPEARNFDLEGSSFDPEARNFGPEASSFDPEARNFGPEASSFDPEARNFGPEASSFDPEARNFGPEASSFDPEARNFDPEASSFETEGFFLPSNMFICGNPSWFVISKCGLVRQRLHGDSPSCGIRTGNGYVTIYWYHLSS
jgi:hypothetical protein